MKHEVIDIGKILMNFLQGTFNPHLDWIVCEEQEGQLNSPKTIHCKIEESLFSGYEAMNVLLLSFHVPPQVFLQQNEGCNDNKILDNNQ